MYRWGLIFWAPQGSAGCRRVPQGAAGYRRVPQGAAGFRRVPQGAEGCGRVPQGAEGCRRTPQTALTDHFFYLAATWLDESFYLVSKDIVESVISRRDSLVCNVWESQSIGYWLKDIPNLATFSDNKRLLHHQTGLGNGGGKRTEICHSFLGIHQSYPEKMRTFWGIYEKEDKPLAYQVPPITYNCKYSIAMDYMAWKNNKFWFSELKLCKDNPIWNSNRDYKGRQGS